MVMNKKERARMNELEREVALARAMRWPEYPAPSPIPKTEYLAGTGAPGRMFQGWIVKGTGVLGPPMLRAVWANAMSHCHTDPEREDQPARQSGTKGPGVAYATVADAWRAYRVQKTREFAETLADIDAQIDAESLHGVDYVGGESE